MKNILIPVDGSDYSIKAIEAGKQIAQAFEAKVTILNVIPVELSRGMGRGNFMYVPSITDDMPDFSEQILKDAKKPFEGTGIQVSTASKQGNIADIIVDYAHQSDFDLVVMGSHGLGALRNRLMTGSVTTRVLHHIDIPVLVIK
jgi:nucleotide-binding universal stress UspA family protein